MTSPARQVGRAALLLGFGALLAVGLLGLIERSTRDKIAQARAATELRALSLVLPSEAFDNLLAEDRIDVIAPAHLGDAGPRRVWRARNGGAPVALVLQAQANDGYAGPIQLLIGVAFDGRITGVRVTEHRETPGLGDAIEAERSDWIGRFIGTSLTQPTSARWALRRDGGEFDQFAGATITPRAVVKAVRLALEYAAAHRDALYASPIGSTLTADDDPPCQPLATCER